MWRVCVTATLLAMASGAVAQADDAAFQAYLGELRGQALAAGVRAATVDAVLPTLTLDPQVIRNDQAQPAPVSSNSFTPFAPYKAQHLNAALIAGGQRVWLARRDRLAGLERETGVPTAVTIAIWGHETSYGAVTGRYDLLRSLATLAFEGRRRALFSGEFVAALKMLDKGVPRDKLRGSWAGAFGGPQFLPSVYLKLARDGDGDGFADVWGSDADSLASIASYLQDAGWRAGRPWGLAVGVPPGFDRSGFRSRLIAPRCPKVFVRHSGWRTMTEWRAAGLIPQTVPWPGDDVMATLIEPDGEGATAYLLTDNYRAILDYNCSNFYALSVGLLADAVTR